MSWDLQVAVGSHSYALLAYGDQVVLPWCTCWAGMRAMRWPRCARLVIPRVGVATSVVHVGRTALAVCWNGLGAARASGASIA